MLCHHLIVGNLFFNRCSLAGIRMGTGTTVMLCVHSEGSIYIALCPDLLLPKFQPCLFQVLDHRPNHQPQSRNSYTPGHLSFRHSESPWAWLSPANWEEFPFILFFRETLGYSSNTMTIHFCVVLTYHAFCPTSMSHSFLAKRNPILFKYSQQYAQGRWTQSQGKNYN